VRWHYQWIILHEFLPLTIGQERVDDILKNGLRFYEVDKRNPLIPIEFSVSAYRFGHSQVRPSYRVNFGPTGGSPFFAFTSDDTQDPNNPDPNDLRGGKRAARRFVDWQTFFNFGDGNFRPNKRIDGKLSTPLMLLPGSRGAAPWFAGRRGPVIGLAQPHAPCEFRNSGRPGDRAEDGRTNIDPHARSLTWKRARRFGTTF